MSEWGWPPFHDTKAGIKLTNTVGPTMWADKSWSIWHPISTMWKHVWSTWSHKICILVSVKHFNPTNVCMMMFTETNLSQTSNLSHSWTQEAVNMAAPAGSWCGVDMSVDSSSWKIRNEQKLMWKVLGTSSVPHFKQTSFKREKKYENHRQAEYHHTLKGRKTLSSAVPRTRTWDLSFMKRVCYQLSFPSKWKTEKNNDNIYLICCSTNVCLFDIPLKHCLTHIVTHCWTLQVGQFGHPQQHYMSNCDIMLDQQYSWIWPQPNPDDICQIIKGMKSHTSSMGVDNIPPQLLIMAAGIIADPLTNLINATMLEESIFPDAKKRASVTPVFEKDDIKLLKTNYRPISVLKGELQRENKLISYERTFKMLENDMYIAGIGQVVLELLSFKVESGNHQRGISLLQKFSDIFGNMRLVPLKMTSHLTSHNFQILKIEIFSKPCKIWTCYLKKW